MCPVSEQAIKHRLSNYNNMSVLRQRQSQKRRKKVKEGINFVLNYFPKDNIFPRAISTQALSREPAVTIVHNKNEMLSVYEQSDFIDCYFLLCKECYWCASSVNLGVSNRIIKCPSCNYACIKLIPIFENETYRIGYSEEHGFTTEFGIKYTQKNAVGV